MAYTRKTVPKSAYDALHAEVIHYRKELDLSKIKGGDNRQAELAWRRQHKEHLRSIRRGCRDMAQELTKLANMRPNQITAEMIADLASYAEVFTRYGAEADD